MENSLNKIEKERLQDIKLLLDNKESVCWKNDLYDVKYDIKNKIIVVCNENNYTTGLQKEDLLNCYTDKWTIRENNYNLKNITTYPNCKK